MEKTQALSPEQQDFVADHYMLIYAFLNKHRLLEEDWYGIVSIALCEAAKRFEAERSRFSTFAFRVMQTAVSKERLRQKRSVSTVSLDEECEEGCSYADRLGYEQDFFAEIAGTDIARFIWRLPYREQAVAAKLQAGKSQAQIARELRMSQPRICQIVASIRQKMIAEYEVEVGGELP